MIISIDTEVMNTMAGLAQQASEEQDASVVSLIPVVEHYDWNCKERDEINERIMNIKKGNQKLSETLQEFAQAIRNVANRFDEEENAIPGRYQYIDTLLGQASAGETPSADTSAVGATFKKIVQDREYPMHDGRRKSLLESKLENYEMGNVTEPIVLERIDFDIKRYFRVGDPETSPNPHKTAEELRERLSNLQLSEELLNEILKKSNYQG